MNDLREKFDVLLADLERAVHRAKFYAEPVTLAMAEDFLQQAKDMDADLDEVHNDCVTEDERDQLERDKEEMGETITDLEDKLAKAKEAAEERAPGLVAIPPELAGKVVRIDFSAPR